MDISSDEEAWVEDYWPAEHLIDITDYEGDIFEAYLDEDEADTPFPEAGMDQSFTTTMDDGEISEAKQLSTSFPPRTMPRYALIAMLMFSVASIACIIELAYKAGKERVIWKCESKLPWFYHSSPNHRRFGTFPEMVGLVCAILQTALSAIAYTFYLQHANYPLNISLWPLVFAMGLFCSKFM
ncbi:Serine/threonine-protein kinase PBS1 [Gossypium australe]|uniref:Serine/threonine-protein kinase PBS1 n=1 Tax=Gossypium australe TaxID=47621 RepID=A0A5B6UF57_9ROSI|nr:Serine/threonine-protein kinase PBS1 [Gossypium australe]